MKKIARLLILPLIIMTCGVILSACGESKFTVKFDSQSGSVVSSFKDVSKGSKINAPTEPTRTGYDFGGWFKESNCVNAWKFEKDKVTSDIKLYAGWTPTNYTIEYLGLQGGTNPDTNPTTYTIESNTITFAMPVNRAGFDGSWDVLSIPTGSVGNRTITAVWTAKTYVASLNKTGGIDGSNSVSVTFNTPMPVAVAPTKAFFDFIGYYSSTGGAGTQYYNSLMESVNNWNIPDNATLYAHWVGKPNRLVFDGNGKTSGVMDEINVKGEQVIALPANSYQKTGYDFIGWNTASNGSGTMYAVGENFTVPLSDENIKLYAQWAPKQVYAIFDGNGATSGMMSNIPVTVNQEINLPANTYLRTGYVFAGWNAQSNGSGENYAAGEGYTIPQTDNNVTFYAQWMEKNWTVVFQNHNGQELQRTQVGNGASAAYNGEDPLKASDGLWSYDFIGWDSDLTNVTRDMLIVAVFERTLISQFEDLRVTYDGTVHLPELICDVPAGFSVKYFEDGVEVQGFADAGTYEITAVIDNGSERFESIAILIIDKATLVVNVNNTSKAEGTQNPEFGITADGFMGSDDEAVLQGALIFKTECDETSVPGIYPVTASGLTATNYDVVFNAGEIEVVVTWTVEFFGFENAWLSTQYVMDGSEAIAPTPGLISGYTFAGWDKSFSSVTGHLLVYAIYEPVIDAPDMPGNVRILGDTLTFDEVPSAEYYEIRINTQIIQSTDATVDLLALGLTKGGYLISVRAVAGGLSSNWTEEVTYLKESGNSNAGIFEDVSPFFEIKVETNGASLNDNNVYGFIRVYDSYGDFVLSTVTPTGANTYTITPAIGRYESGNWYTAELQGANIKFAFDGCQDAETISFGIRADSTSEDTYRVVQKSTVIEVSLNDIIAIFTDENAMLFARSFNPDDAILITVEGTNEKYGIVVVSCQPYVYNDVSYFKVLFREAAIDDIYEEYNVNSSINFSDAFEFDQDAAIAQVESSPMVRALTQFVFNKTSTRISPVVEFSVRYQGNNILSVTTNVTYENALDGKDLRLTTVDLIIMQNAKQSGLLTIDFVYSIMHTKEYSLMLGNTSLTSGDMLYNDLCAYLANMSFVEGDINQSVLKVPLNAVGSNCVGYLELGFIFEYKYSAEMLFEYRSTFAYTHSIRAGLLSISNKYMNERYEISDTNLEFLGAAHINSAVKLTLSLGINTFFNAKISTLVGLEAYFAGYVSDQSSNADLNYENLRFYVDLDYEIKGIIEVLTKRGSIQIFDDKQINAGNDELAVQIYLKSDEETVDTVYVTNVGGVFLPDLYVLVFDAKTMTYREVLLDYSNPAVTVTVEGSPSYISFANGELILNGSDPDFVLNATVSYATQYYTLTHNFTLVAAYEVFIVGSKTLEFDVAQPESISVVVMLGSAEIYGIVDNGIFYTERVEQLGGGIRKLILTFNYLELFGLPYDIYEFEIITSANNAKFTLTVGDNRGVFFPYSTVNYEKFKVGASNDAVFMPNLFASDFVEVTGHGITPSDYSFDKNSRSLVIKGTYLNTLEDGEFMFAFVTTNGISQSVSYFTIFVADITKAEVGEEFTYDKAGTGALLVDIKLNGSTFGSVYSGGISTSDFAFAGSTLTINAEFLAGLDLGTHNFTLMLSKYGQGYEIPIRVVVFDNRTPHALDGNIIHNIETDGNLEIEFALYGRALQGIENVDASNYQISGNRLIIKQSYLASRTVGNVTFNIITSIETVQVSILLIDNNSIALPSAVVTYNKLPQTLQLIAPASFNAVVTYSYYYSNTGTWSTTAPVNVGVYTVRATFNDGQARVYTATLTIKQAVLEISQRAVISKVYDGTTSFSGALHSYITTSAEAGDFVVVDFLSASYNSSQVNLASYVTFKNLVLSGTAAGNYVLASTTLVLEAEIAQKLVPISVTAFNKTFDGSVLAQIRYSIPLASSEYAFTLVMEGFFDTPYAGVNKTVTLNVLYLDVTYNSGNYRIPTAIEIESMLVRASIYQQEVNVAFTASDKVYDGTNAATVQYDVKSGVVLGFDVQVSYSSVFIGDGVGYREVKLSGIRLTGEYASSYKLNANFPPLHASITRRTVSIQDVTTETSKVYDSTTTARITGIVISNAVSGDSIAVSGVFADYDDKNVGSGKTITIRTAVPTLYGKDAGNYYLDATPNSTFKTLANVGVITPRAVTAFVATQGKTYDGENNTEMSARFTLSGIMRYDDLSLADNTLVFNLPSGSAGVYQVYLSKMLNLSGGDKNNYYLTNSSFAQSVSITVLQRVITLKNAYTIDKTYDGTNVIDFYYDGLDGVLPGDTVNESFDYYSQGVNAGTHKVVFSNINSGNPNYRLTLGSYNVTIDKKLITPSDIQVNNKVFDGTTSAAFSIISWEGLVGKDGITASKVKLTGATATFAQATVGSGINVTVVFTNAAINLANYKIDKQFSQVFTANIVKKDVSVYATPGRREYNGVGDTSVSVGYGFSGLVKNYANVTLDGHSAWLESGAAGNQKVLFNEISSWSLTGADENNYNFTGLSNAGNVFAYIYKKQLTVKNVVVVGGGKIYDGNANAEITFGSLNGVVPADEGSIEIVGHVATYNSKNAGNSKTVTITFSLNDSSNYTVKSEFMTAVITKKQVSVTEVVAQDKIYDGTNLAGFNIVNISGVISGDNVKILGAEATFADKNVGDNKLVTIDYASAYSSNSNYELSVAQSVKSAFASIKPKTLGVIFYVDNRAYEKGNTQVPLRVSLYGVVPGDSIRATASANYLNDSAGVGKTAHVPLANEDGGVRLSSDFIGAVDNYVLGSYQTTVYGTITPKRVALADVEIFDKIYDGKNTAQVKTYGDVQGVFDGDVVQPINNSVRAYFNDKNVGVNKIVYVYADSNNPNYTIYVDTCRATITPYEIFITGFTIADKVYDGTLTAIIKSISYENEPDFETVYPSGLRATFSSKNVGSRDVFIPNTAVYPNFIFTYRPAADVATANITPRSVTLSVSASNKTYDANRNANISVSVNGLLSDEMLVRAEGLIGTFTVADAGYNKVIISGQAILVDNTDGTVAGNYVISSVAQSTWATIYRKQLTLQGFALADKTYDGGTGAVVTNEGVLVGLVGGDEPVFTTYASFTNKNVGVNKTASISVVLDSNGDKNYYINSFNATSSASITPKALTYTVYANDKTYDTNDIAVVSVILGGVVGNDDVRVSGVSGRFATANAGENIEVTVDWTVLVGAASLNYTLNKNDGDNKTTANISKKAASVLINTEHKVYDGTTAATMAGFSIPGVLQSDEADISVAVSDLEFANSNVGIHSVTGKIVITGAKAENYDFAVIYASASITPKTIIVAGIKVEGKVYDGTTVVSEDKIDYSDVQFIGLIEFDSVNIQRVTARYTSANQNPYAPITVTSVLLDNSNYTARVEETITAAITAKEVTALPIVANKPYDGATIAKITGYEIIGLVSGGGFTVQGSLTARFPSATAGDNYLIAFDGDVLPNLVGDTNGNYVLTGLYNELVYANIEKVNLYFKYENYGRTYGDANPKIQLSYISGLVEIEQHLNGQFDLWLANYQDFEIASSVGEYVISGAYTYGTLPVSLDNYNIITTAGSLKIIARDLTVDYLGGVVTKVYDKSTSASIAEDLFEWGNFAFGDTLNISFTAAYNDMNVQSASTVTVSFTVSGAKAKNYNAVSKLTVSARITPRELVVEHLVGYLDPTGNRVLHIVDMKFTQESLPFKDTISVSTVGEAYELGYYFDNGILTAYVMNIFFNNSNFIFDTSTYASLGGIQALTISGAEYTIAESTKITWADGSGSGSHSLAEFADEKLKIFTYGVGYYSIEATTGPGTAISVGVVRFEANGGRSVKDVTLYDGKVMMLSDVSHTNKQGFIFMGWFLDAEFETPAPAVLNPFGAPDKVITLYASWEEYTIPEAVDDLIKYINVMYSTQKVGYYEISDMLKFVKQSYNLLTLEEQALVTNWHLVQEVEDRMLALLTVEYTFRLDGDNDGGNHDYFSHGNNVKMVFDIEGQYYLSPANYDGEWTFSHWEAVYFKDRDQSGMQGTPVEYIERGTNNILLIAVFKSTRIILEYRIDLDFEIMDKSTTITNENNPRDWSIKDNAVWLVQPQGIVWKKVAQMDGWDFIGWFDINGKKIEWIDSDIVNSVGEKGVVELTARFAPTITSPQIYFIYTSGGSLASVPVQQGMSYSLLDLFKRSGYNSSNFPVFLYPEEEGQPMMNIMEDRIHMGSNSRLVAVDFIAGTNLSFNIPHGWAFDLSFEYKDTGRRVFYNNISKWQDITVPVNSEITVHLTNISSYRSYRIENREGVFRNGSIHQILGHTFITLIPIEEESKMTFVFAVYVDGVSDGLCSIFTKSQIDDQIYEIWDGRIYNEAWKINEDLRIANYTDIAFKFNDHVGNPVSLSFEMLQDYNFNFAFAPDRVFLIEVHATKITDKHLTFKFVIFRDNVLESSHSMHKEKTIWDPELQTEVPLDVKLLRDELWFVNNLISEGYTVKFNYKTDSTDYLISSIEELLDYTFPNQLGYAYIEVLATREHVIEKMTLYFDVFMDGNKVNSHVVNVYSGRYEGQTWIQWDRTLPEHELHFYQYLIDKGCNDILFIVDATYNMTYDELRTNFPIFQKGNVYIRVEAHREEMTIQLNSMHGNSMSRSFTRNEWQGSLLNSGFYMDSHQFGNPEEFFITFEYEGNMWSYEEILSRPIGFVDGFVEIKVHRTARPQYFMSFIFYGTKGYGQNDVYNFHLREGQAINTHHEWQNIQRMFGMYTIYTNPERTHIATLPFGGNAITSDIDYYVQHTPAFTVTFKNGDEVHAAVRIEESTARVWNDELSTALKTPLRNGFAFCYWSETVDGERVDDFLLNTLLRNYGSDITLYAVWMPISGTINNSIVGLWQSSGFKTNYIFFENGVGLLKTDKYIEHIQYRFIGGNEWRLYRSAYSVVGGEAFFVLNDGRRYLEFVPSSDFCYEVFDTIEVTLKKFVPRYENGYQMAVIEETVTYLVSADATFNDLLGSKDPHDGETMVYTIGGYTDIVVTYETMLANHASNGKLLVHSYPVVVDNMGRYQTGFIHLNAMGGEFDGHSEMKIYYQSEIKNGYTRIFAEHKIVDMLPVKEDGGHFVGWFNDEGKEIINFIDLFLLNNENQGNNEGGVEHNGGKKGELSTNLTAKFIDVPELENPYKEAFVGSWTVIRYNYDWQYQLGGLAKITLTFNGNGTYSYTMLISGEKRLDTAGIYRYNNGSIDILTGHPIFRAGNYGKISLRLLDFDMLVLGDTENSSHSMILVKVGSTGELAPVNYSGMDFLGAYYMYDEKIELGETIELIKVDIELRYDGKYSMTRVIAQRDEFGELVTTPENEEGDYRLIDGRICLWTRDGLVDVHDIIMLLPKKGDSDYTNVKAIGDWYYRGAMPIKLTIGEDGYITSETTNTYWSAKPDENPVQVTETSVQKMQYKNLDKNVLMQMFSNDDSEGGAAIAEMLLPYTVETNVTASVGGDEMNAMIYVMLEGFDVSKINPAVPAGTIMDLMLAINTNNGNFYEFVQLPAEVNYGGEEFVGTYFMHSEISFGDPSMDEKSITTIELDEEGNYAMTTTLEQGGSMMPATPPEKGIYRLLGGRIHLLTKSGLVDVADMLKMLAKVGADYSEADVLGDWYLLSGEEGPTKITFDTNGFVHVEFEMYQMSVLQIMHYTEVDPAMLMSLFGDGGGDGYAQLIASVSSVYASMVADDKGMNNVFFVFFESIDAMFLNPNASQGEVINDVLFVIFPDTEAPFVFAKDAQFQAASVA